MTDFKPNLKEYENLREWTTDEELEEDRAYYARLVEQVKLAMSKVGASKYELGLELLRLFESNVYVSDSRWVYPNKNSNGNYYSYTSNFAFFRECEKNFDLDKSQVSRYVNIVCEFGDRENGLKPEWAAYSWSQLVELLPLTPEEREKVNPEMTVVEIRAYKQSLVATSQQEEKTENRNVKSVATSQHKPYFIKSTNFSSDSDMKYWRFLGCSVQYVCDQVFQAEAKVRELERKLADLEALSVPISDSDDVYKQ